MRKDNGARGGHAGARNGSEAEDTVAQDPATPVVVAGRGSGSDDRGPYGVIFRRLFHRADFRSLSLDAKTVYMYARCCPAGGLVGIFPLRPEDIRDDLGLGVRKAERALVELDEAGFIHRERNWIWIIDSLASTPGISTSNPNHRLAIFKGLANVPDNLALACRKLYGLNTASEIPSEIPSAMPSEIP